MIGIAIGAIAGGTIGGMYAYDQAVSDGATGLELYLRTANGITKGAVLGGLIGGVAGYYSPLIGTFLGSSFNIMTPIMLDGVIGSTVAISVTGAELVGAATIGAGILYFSYERKKAAPRIKSSTKKQAYDKAFYKGGKKPPIYHHSGKYGPHFHPNNLKFKHWHYYFSILWWLTNEFDDNI